MKKKKKRAFSLMEVLLVMLLMTLIGGAVSINVKKSLDRGRAFNTVQKMRQIHSLLTCECDLSRNVTGDEIDEALSAALTKKKREDLERDGWGSKIQVAWSKELSDFTFESEAFSHYRDKNPKAMKKLQVGDLEIL